MQRLRIRKLQPEQCAHRQRAAHFLVHPRELVHLCRRGMQGLRAARVQEGLRAMSVRELIDILNSSWNLDAEVLINTPEGEFEIQDVVTQYDDQVYIDIVEDR